VIGNVLGHYKAVLTEEGIGDGVDKKNSKKGGLL
jgi:hypothetical protein